jgi:hypothetical protein
LPFFNILLRPKKHWHNLFFLALSII